jgi:hypothetical protein
MFSSSKIYGNKLFSAPIKPPGNIPTKSLYAKDVYIYFLNSEQLKDVLNNMGIKGSITCSNLKKKLINISQLPNSNLKKGLINILQSNTIKDNEIKKKLKSYKTQNEYAETQKIFREFHKNLKKISNYRYIREKELIEIMPNFKKELDKFKDSYFSRNFSKIVAQIVIKMYGIDNIKELLPQILLLCEYLSDKTGYYTRNDFKILTFFKI